MSVKKAAEILNVKPKSLHAWLDKYEQENGPIPGRQRFTTYSQEQKEEFVQKAIPLIEQGMSLSKIAKQLGVNIHNLKEWLEKHKEKYGPIHKGQKQTTSPQKKKTIKTTAQSKSQRKARTNNSEKAKNKKPSGNHFINPIKGEHSKDYKKAKS